MTIQTFLHPGISKILSSQFFLRVTWKATYSVSVGQILALCATYCTSHALKPDNMGLKNGQFLSFPDMLTPTISNLLTVLASKLKLKINYMKTGLLRECVR